MSTHGTTGSPVGPQHSPKRATSAGSLLRTPLPWPKTLVATYQQHARTISDLTGATAAIGAGQVATVPSPPQQAHHPP